MLSTAVRGGQRVYRWVLWTHCVVELWLEEPCARDYTSHLDAESGRSHSRGECHPQGRVDALVGGHGSYDPWYAVARGGQVGAASTTIRLVGYDNLPKMYN